MPKSRLIGVNCVREEPRKEPQILTTKTAIAQKIGRNRNSIDLPDKQLKMYVRDYRSRRAELNQCLACDWAVDDYCLWCLLKYQEFFGNKRPRPPKEKTGQALRKMANQFNLENYENSRTSIQTK